MVSLRLKDNLLRRQGVQVKTRYPPNLDKTHRRMIVNYLKESGWISTSSWHRFYLGLLWQFYLFYSQKSGDEGGGGGGGRGGEGGNRVGRGEGSL